MHNIHNQARKHSSRITLESGLCVKKLDEIFELIIYGNAHETVNSKPFAIAVLYA